MSILSLMDLALACLFHILGSSIFLAISQPLSQRRSIPPHIYIEDNAHGNHAGEHIRAPIAEKRQRDACNWHYAHIHTDILHDMEQEHGHYACIWILRSNRRNLCICHQSLFRLAGKYLTMRCYYLFHRCKERDVYKRQDYTGWCTQRSHGRCRCGDFEGK